MNAPATTATEYGVTPLEVMATMTGLDFVRAVGCRNHPPVLKFKIRHK